MRIDIDFTIIPFELPELVSKDRDQLASDIAVFNSEWHESCSPAQAVSQLICEIGLRKRIENLLTTVQEDVLPELQKAAIEVLKQSSAKIQDQLTSIGFVDGSAPLAVDGITLDRLAGWHPDVYAANEALTDLMDWNALGLMAANRLALASCDQQHATIAPTLSRQSTVSLS